MLSERKATSACLSSQLTLLGRLVGETVPSQAVCISTSLPMGCQGHFAIDNCHNPLWTSWAVDLYEESTQLKSGKIKGILVETAVETNKIKDKCMKETSWIKEEEQRRARHLFVTGYKQESNFTQAELAGLLMLLSSVTHSGYLLRWHHVYDIHMDVGSCQLMKWDT